MEILLLSISFMVFTLMVVGINAFFAKFAFTVAWTVFPPAVIGLWGFIMLQFVLWIRSTGGDAPAVLIAHTTFVFFVFIGTVLGARSAARSTL